MGWDLLVGIPNVYIATGDSGMRMTHGTIAAILIRDLIMNVRMPGPPCTILSKVAEIGEPSLIFRRSRSRKLCQIFTGQARRDLAQFIVMDFAPAEEFSGTRP